MIKKLLRPNILRLKPYTSARDSYLNGILLDANENAYGSVAGDAELNLNRYPDPAQREERKVLSKYLNLPEENLFFGVGSDEIIDLLIRMFCEPATNNVIINEPTYGMYKVACDINNVKTKIALLDNTFQLNVELLLQKIEKNTKMIFLCSPNNPTGECLKKDSILKLSELANAIIIIDEAYIDFSEDKSVINEVLNYENLVVLRTFSKAWGLAGIRCGYCAANKLIIDTLMKVKAPYNLNSLTRNVIKEAIENSEQKNEYVEKIISQRNYIINELKSMNKIEKVYDSDSNFVLFKIKKSNVIFNTLCKNGIIIRDRSSQIGLENCLRVSVGTPAENQLFIETMKELL